MLDCFVDECSVVSYTASVQEPATADETRAFDSLFHVFGTGINTADANPYEPTPLAVDMSTGIGMLEPTPILDDENTKNSPMSTGSLRDLFLLGEGRQEGLFTF